MGKYVHFVDKKSYFSGGYPLDHNLEDKTKEKYIKMLETIKCWIEKGLKEASENVQAKDVKATSEYVFLFWIVI